ncbi:MAG: hypothetical protein ACI9TH_004371, partial [Kiritimatiellia bacterium]
MKYLFNLLMPIVASAILLQPAMAADTTVVFVDLDKAFNEYY